MLTRSNNGVRLRAENGDVLRPFEPDAGHAAVRKSLPHAEWRNPRIGFMDSAHSPEQPPERPIAATIGIILRQGSVILVRRANPPDAGRWGLPGGKINKGETIAEAAVREILEETGVTTKAKKIFTAIDVFDVREDGKLHRHFILVAVLCEWVSGEPVANDDALEARWFTREEREQADLALSLDVLEVINLAESIYCSQ